MIISIHRNRISSNYKMDYLEDIHDELMNRYQTKNNFGPSVIAIDVSFLQIQFFEEDHDMKSDFVLYLHNNKPIAYVRIPFNDQQVIISEFDPEYKTTPYTNEIKHDLKYIIKIVDNAIIFCKSLDKKSK